MQHRHIRRFICLAWLGASGVAGAVAAQGEAAPAEPAPVSVYVLPGGIKSSDAEFAAACGSQCLAELARASLLAEGFRVLEPASLGGAWAGYVDAINLGDTQAAARALASGPAARARWVVKLDLMDTHRMAQQFTWVNSPTVAEASRYAQPPAISPLMPPELAGTVGTGMVRARVDWRLTMRYQILDATSTELLAQGQTQLRREVSALVRSPGKPLPVAEATISAQNATELLRDLVRQAVHELATEHPAVAQAGR